MYASNFADLLLLLLYVFVLLLNIFGGNISGNMENERCGNVETWSKDFIL